MNGNDTRGAEDKRQGRGRTLRKREGGAGQQAGGKGVTVSGQTLQLNPYGTETTISFDGPL